MTETWPKVLQPVAGPMRAAELDGAAAGMGDWGAQTRRLAAEGFVPPDMLCELTLFLLSNQPKSPDRKQKIPGGGGGVAGGVWVRERFTIHRPLDRENAFSVSGASIGRYIRKGRRYGVNASTTLNAAGEKVASNLTIGLLAYKVEAGLEDGVEGEGPETATGPTPDEEAAVKNPCREQLRSMAPDTEFGGYPVPVGLDLMKARDTDEPNNPIHSDPEQARKAGLSRPIAGGSHVLAFALEPILAAAGRQCLYHGACFDIRWKAPVYADAVIRPHVRVTASEDRKVAFAFDATLDNGDTAMTGTVVVPVG